MSDLALFSLWAYRILGLWSAFLAAYFGLNGVWDRFAAAGVIGLACAWRIDKITAEFRRRRQTHPQHPPASAAERLKFYKVTR